MKRLSVLLLIALFAAPAVGLADPKVDFNAKCAKCHRATKALPNMAKQLGVDPGKLALRDSRMNKEEMIAIIEKGRDKMPGFEREMTREQVSVLVEYIMFMKDRKTLPKGDPGRLY